MSKQAVEEPVAEILQPGERQAHDAGRDAQRALLHGSGEEHEAALRQALQDGLDLEKWSDGRAWSEQLVLDEIYHYAKAEVLISYEVGRRLIWAKHSLPSGRWSAWCSEHLPWSGAKVRQLMQVAAWLQPHQRLLASSGRLGISKLLEFVKLPPELEQHLGETGEIGGVSVEDMADMTYTELKRFLEKEQKRADRAEQEQANAEARAVQAEQRALKAEAAVGQVVAADALAADTMVRQMHKDLDATLIMVGFKLDQLARRIDEFPPALQIRIRGLASYLRDFAQLEEARFRSLAGEQVFGSEYPEFTRAGEPAADVYQFPKARVPLFFDEASESEIEQQARLLDKIAHYDADEVERAIATEQSRKPLRDWVMEALVERQNELATDGHRA